MTSATYSKLSYFVDRTTKISDTDYDIDPLTRNGGKYWRTP